MKEKIKDVLKRTFKTFVQGFFGALVVILPNSDYNNEAFIKSALIGALAGGICAVMNLIIKALEPKYDLDELDQEEENTMEIETNEKGE